MTTKTFKFPVELGTVLDQAVRVGGVGLKTLPGVNDILNEYKVYHLCIVLKNYITGATCANRSIIKDLSYDIISSVEHIIDTFGTDDVDELFDLLNSGTYKYYRINNYVVTDVATEVTFTLD